MTIEIVFANSISGNTNGGITDIDEGISAADGSFASSATDGEGEIWTIGFADVVSIVDADTVNSITVRSRLGLGTLPGYISHDFRIGGVIQGTQQDTPALTTVFVNYELSDAGWDADHSVSELNGMDLLLECKQVAMPVNTVYAIDCIEIEIDYTESGGGDQTIAVNTAIEADTAQALQHRIIPLLAIETDSAQIVVPDDGAAPQLIAVNTAIETDIALVLDPKLILNRAAEADTARAISPVLIIGQAVETDTGRKLDPLLILQIASEADTALVVNPDVVEPQFITPGIAIEVDTGRTINALQILNRAEETDTALEVVPALNVSTLLDIATDTETARPLTPVLILGLAEETDTGRLITPLLTLGRTVETDSALAITPKLIIQLAIETDIALGISPSQAIELAVGLALETDTALAITPSLTVITLGGQYNILESFPTGQGDVTVTLYDPITGNSVALDDTECKEIGNTGMYIWGNDKLTTQPIGYQEYLYQITDGVTTVDGILRMPQYELVKHIIGNLASN